MITVTKQFRFEAAHYLPEYEGECKNVHGHSYLLEMEFKSPNKKDYQPQLGAMIVDFGDIKSMSNRM